MSEYTVKTMDWKPRDFNLNIQIYPIFTHIITLNPIQVKIIKYGSEVQNTSVKIFIFHLLIIFLFLGGVGKGVDLPQSKVENSSCPVSQAE